MTAARDELDRLSQGKYLLVTTHRKDGRTVPTPVWMARDGDALLIWTERNSGKVKRIRNRPEVELAPCDARGRPKGEPASGTAELLGPEDTERCRGLIARKYGVIGRLAMLGSTIRRGKSGTIGVRITVS